VCARNCLMLTQTTKTSSRGRNNWGNRGFLLRPRNETALLSVEKPVLPKSEESWVSHIKLYEYVRDRFWLWGHCLLIICSSRPNG
jgi:hypothetical protein